jgi:hypothetical protein
MNEPPVARIERSEIRERLTNMAMLTPGFASLNPGYSCYDRWLHFAFKYHSRICSPFQCSTPSNFAA